jgi:hypothetical protein
MQTSNPWALKEWAVICRALAAGRQCVLLRKGGIAEPDGVFRVEHPEFWLLQTHFHEDPSQLSSEASAFASTAARHESSAGGTAARADRAGGAGSADRPEASANQSASGGRLMISAYAVVTAVWPILDERRLEPLAPFHIWSQETILRRFRYRQPGLFAICVRVYNRPNTLRIADTPEIAGCRSWVELPSGLPTDDLSPALDDDAFARATRQLATALA